MRKFMRSCLDAFKSNLIIIIIFSLVLAAETYELDYSVYSPGGLINVANRLDNIPYDSSGSFNITYVSYRKGTLMNLLIAKILPNYDIIENSDILIPDEDLVDLNNREKLQIQQSLTGAYYVAYHKANKQIDIKYEDDYIYYVYNKEDNKLRVGDKLLKCDGRDIANFNDLGICIDSFNENDIVTLTVERNKKTIDVPAKVYLDEEEKRIGVIVTKIYNYDLDPKINYKYDKNESGGSGGLMLALTLYNSLVEEDITHGKKIAGTGTIDLYGDVGEISGVKYKLAGAVKKKADAFIVPEANYDEAIEVKEKNNYSIKIIKATNFEQVLNELNNI